MVEAVERGIRMAETEKKIKFTDEQQRVIDSRNKNLLVSAAAGSGKTAVLVERIIQIVTNSENPVDIDRLLVVTFTEAAAAQMRDKIASALEKLLEKEPENVHIQKQSALLYKAQISTIHSFCLNIIRNNFNEIGLDPAFRVADETELKLLEQDVLNELMEELYGTKDERFLDLVEFFSKGVSDDYLRDSILKIYSFSEGYPWPEEWLELQDRLYSEANEDIFVNSEWIDFLYEYLQSLLEEALKLIEKAKRYAELPDGPAAYMDQLISDEEQIKYIMSQGTVGEMFTAFRCLEYKKLSSATKGCDPELKKKVQDIRDEYKGFLSDAKKTNSLKNYMFDSEKVELKKLSDLYPIVHELIDIVKIFSDRYAKKRIEKGIISFSDMEHYALRILYVQNENNERVLSKVAAEYRNHFVEILMDEYQDCNRVQEELMIAICGEPDGRYNRFMVGDVKQSIYRFRLAKPELFIDKYNCYTNVDLCGQSDDGIEFNTDNELVDVEEVHDFADESDVEGMTHLDNDELICLHSNFRSRANVVDTVNTLFAQIMHSDLGRVEYDADARLVCGANYPSMITDDIIKAYIEDMNRNLDATKSEMTNLEDTPKTLDTGVVFGESNSENLNHDFDYSAPNSIWNTEVILGDYDEDSDYKKNIQEGYLIADKIKSLIGHFPVTNEQGDGFRMASYKDIVILVRSMTDVAEGLKKVLSDEGIPSVMSLNTGFFDTKEIQQIVQFLKVVDNPRQDIPLYGSLVSYFGQVSDSEMAYVKANYCTEEYDCLYDGVLNAVNDADEGRGTELDGLRERLSAFNDLLEKYRKLSEYVPIHDLINELVIETGYIEYLEAKAGGAQRVANVKALINKAQSFEGTSYKGLFHFIRYISELRKIEADDGEADITSENADVVRIMTIHKSKGLEFPICILAGIHKQFNIKDTTGYLSLDMDYGIGLSNVNMSKRIKNDSLFKKVINLKLRQDMLGEELRVLYVALTRAKEKLIITGIIKNRDKFFEQVSSVCGEISENGRLSKGYLSFSKSYMDFMMGIMDTAKICSMSKVSDKEVDEGIEKLNLESEIIRYTDNLEDDNELVYELKERINRKYQHEDLEGLVLKTSVSELKKNYIDMTFAEEIFKHEDDTKKYEPSFAKERDDSISATDRGSAYHKVMELLDFTDKDIKSQINNMVAKGLISETWAQAVPVYKIEKFMASKLAERMAQAQKNGSLKREQPFVMAIEANRVKDSYPNDEKVLLQGIIDAFFIEDDKIILVDYKTDVINTPQELFDRYRVQVMYYCEALSKAYGLQVTESILYSFCLGCCVTDEE